MTKLFQKWQDYAIKKYGMGDWRTRIVFRLTRIVF